MLLTSFLFSVIFVLIDCCDVVEWRKCTQVTNAIVFQIRNWYIPLSYIGLVTFDRNAPTVPWMILKPGKITADQIGRSEVVHGSGTLVKNIHKSSSLSTVLFHVLNKTLKYNSFPGVCDSLDGLADSDAEHEAAGRQHFLLSECLCSR